MFDKINLKFILSYWIDILLKIIILLILSNKFFIKQCYLNVLHICKINLKYLLEKISYGFGVIFVKYIFIRCQQIKKKLKLRIN